MKLPLQMSVASTANAMPTAVLRFKAEFKN
jgi:hypothetical protein